MSEQYTREVEGDPGDYTVVTKRLIEEIDYQWQRFDSRSASPLVQAGALIELSNLMSDLISWHPDYDYEIGEIVYDDQ